MKRYKKSNVYTASTYTNNDRYTTFYKTDIEHVQHVLSENDVNVWLQKSIEVEKFDAIDFKNNLFGSNVIDGELYLCVSNETEITVNDEKVDPEDALDTFSLSELSKYIKPATDDIILSYITTYEIYQPDFDKYSEELLSEGVSFERMFNDAKFWLN